MTGTEIVTIPSLELATREIIGELVDGWHEYLVSEKSQETVNVYVKGLRLFREYLDREGLEFADVKPSVVRGWRDELHNEGKSRSTINIWLTSLRRFYSYLVTEHDIALVNPAVGVKAKGRPGNGMKRGELLSADILALQEACQDGTETGARDWAVLGLMAYTAMRTNEVKLTDLEDFGTQGDKRTLLVQGKGHVEKDDFVIISPEADEALRPWLAIRGGEPGALFLSLSNRSKNERLSNRSIRKIWEKRSAQAGIVGDNLTIHSLRHSAISNAIRHGADLFGVQKMARHASIETTMKYFHHRDRLESPAEFMINYDNGI